jgi:hypothetical protein
LDSNIIKGKRVEFLGVGNVAGWYIIRNPYFHQPCWIEAVDLKILPGTDITTFPVMTPGIPTRIPDPGLPVQKPTFTSGAG